MENDRDELRDEEGCVLTCFEEEMSASGDVALNERAETLSTNSTELDIPELDEAEVEQAQEKTATSEENDRNEGKLVIIDDPYVAGQCTTRVTLVISPNNDHEQGPLVFIAASTHDDLPRTIVTCRLNELALPPQIHEAIAATYGTLSQRGEEKAAARQLAAQKKREADEKEKLRKDKKLAVAKKEAERKKTEEKRANEPTAMDMFAALQ